MGEILRSRVLLVLCVLANGMVIHMLATSAIYSSVNTEKTQKDVFASPNSKAKLVKIISVFFLFLCELKLEAPVLPDSLSETRDHVDENKPKRSDQFHHLSRITSTIFKRNLESKTQISNYTSETSPNKSNPQL